MQEFISQIAERFGVDEGKAGEILSHLTEAGHDIPSMLQQGNFAENVKGLLGDKLGDVLHGVPGIGEMFSNMLGDKQQEE